MSELDAHTHNDAGIDTCKAWLDVHIHPANVATRFPNDKKGHKAVVALLAKYSVRRVIIEATGKFHRSVFARMHEAGFCVHVVNPLRSRLFADLNGKLAKTDKVDARMLALFAALHDLEGSEPMPENLENLQEIVRSRAAVMAEKTAVTNQLKTLLNPAARKQIERLAIACQKAADALEAEALKVIASDKNLARRHEILVSIPGIGDITAACLIANMPELGDMTEKQAGMLAGLAPIACESGDKIGTRRIRAGRHAVRTGTYMAARSASRVGGPLKDFFDRLIAAGKPDKVAITAVMRKLIVLANALLKADRVWELTAPKGGQNRPIRA